MFLQLISGSLWGPLLWPLARDDGVNGLHCANDVSVRLLPLYPAFMQGEQLFHQKLHWNKVLIEEVL